jgi:hypothetical protein
MAAQRLGGGVLAGGLPVVCSETRNAKAFLKAAVNKSEWNGARVIAQMMRVNLFRPVRVKTTSEKRRALPTARKLLQDKAIAIENDIRGLRRNFGPKPGSSARSRSTNGSGLSSACPNTSRSSAVTRRPAEASRDVHQAPPQITVDLGCQPVERRAIVVAQLSLPCE